MRTSLTFFFAITTICLFAQKNHSLSSFTEISAGVNYAQFTGNNALAQRGDYGWQFGVSRRHQLSNILDLSYGASLVSVKHHATFEETTIAYVDKGFRSYNHSYFRVPIDIYYHPIAKRNLFVMGGFNMSSDVSNISTESFIRTQYVDDSGYRYEQPTQKSIRQFRETGTLDLSFRLGVGTRVNFNKMVYSVSIAYNQGLINKDMGMKQNQLECQVSMTMPHFKGGKSGFSTINPLNWVN